MKKSKTLIIAIIIVIVFIIVVIGILSNKVKKDNEVKVNTITEQNTSSLSNTSSASNALEVTNTAMYFTVKSCIDTYTKYISTRNNKGIYSVLATDYIDEKNITVENVFEKISYLQGNNIDFSIEKMMVENDGEDVQTYYVAGKMRNENNDKKDIQLTVNVDIINRVFTIIPEVKEGVFN